MTCPVCRSALTRVDPDAPWRCVPCATIVRHTVDEHGHLLLGWNASAKLCFQARATHRLNDTGPHRANASDSSPLDAWLPGGSSPAHVKAVKTA